MALPAAETAPSLGAGLVGAYTRGPQGQLRFEGLRPGAGWHRHDWRPRQLTIASDAGVGVIVVQRRRWRLWGTTETKLDRAPDEVGGIHFVLLVVLVRAAGWLLSGEGLHTYTEPRAHLRRLGHRRTVQRWVARRSRDAARLQGALRTAVLERSEPQPVERLFPGGLSPPEAVGRRRWKDPEATFQLAHGLAFLVHGAHSFCTSMTVLLAEARRRLDGPLVIPRS